MSNDPGVVVEMSCTYTGVMSIMGRSGDVQAMWNSNNPDEVAAAKKTFDDLVGKKRYLAFTVKEADGKQGDQIREFNPALGKIILVPPMQGG